MQWDGVTLFVLRIVVNALLVRCVPLLFFFFAIVFFLFWLVFMFRVCC